MLNRYVNFCFIIFIIFIFLASILDFLGSLSYYFNFEGKNIFIPYYSDRNVVPFPLLFKEFDLSNENAIKSNVERNRGSDELCLRRLLTEYDNYRLNKDNIFENVPNKGFVAPKDSPPGWLSYTPLDKLVLNLFDAYRFDYVVHDPLLEENPKDVRSIYNNKMTTFYDLMRTPKSEDHVRLYKLISSYPTLTVFAVKGILSGDTRNVGLVSDNRNPTDLKIDHLPNQIHLNNLRINLIGDVTAYDMAPHSFDNHITNKHKNTVNDIYNADQMIYDNFKEYIDRSDVLMLHLVGADHLSHCGGRNTSEMTKIMKNYNRFVKDLLNECQKKRNYMLMFFGDHGQKESGSHGDDSEEETETFLITYSDLKLRNQKLDYCPLSQTPRAYRLHHSALNGSVDVGFEYGHQFTNDICTTASLLTNVPIPFNSEGLLIPTSVPLIVDSRGEVDRKLSDKYLVQLHHVNVHHLLRIVDILSQNDEVRFSERHYNRILCLRLRLANMYTLLRLVDTSNNPEFVDVNTLYDNYVSLCNRLCELSSQLIKTSTRSFTFHYLYVSIIIKYVSIIILVYCLVCTLKYYKMGRYITDPDLDKKVEGTIVRKVLFRLVRSVFVSLIVSVVFGSDFKREINLYFFIVHVRWPLGVFAHFCKTAQKLTAFFSKFLVIEEYDIYLHFTVLYAFLLTAFFIYDSKLLFTSYKFLLSDEFTLGKKVDNKVVKYSSALKTFCYNVGRFSLRKLTTILFCVVFILVIVSECALYSHDTISRHLLVIFMLIETLPFMLRDGESYLYGKIKMRLFILFALSKLSSFFHDYRLFFYATDLPTASWLSREKFLNLFEVGAFSLFVYYLLLMRFMMNYNQGTVNQSKDHFEFSVMSCANVFKKKKLMFLVYTVNFLCVLLNYGLTTQSSLLGLNKFIANFHNAYYIKMFVSTMFAWVVLALFMLSSLLLLLNPFHLFFDSNQPYRFSSFLLYTIPNLCFMIFLVSGHKKAFQLLLGILILYQSCVILICKNSNFYLSHALLLQSVADSIYFANGSIDNLLNLNFQTGFIFVTNYYGPISDTTVLFEVLSVHILFSIVLMFSYFNGASLKYDLISDQHSIEAGFGSFELHTSDKFQTYLTKSINDEYNVDVKPNEVSRKNYTLRKILHVITLFIFLISVSGFSILIAIMKLHHVPCIALRSFPKALFILGKCTSMFVTQLMLFVLRSFI